MRQTFLFSLIHLKNLIIRRMAKLSKQEMKLHYQAEEILKKEVLTYDEKLFVLDNWQESANNINGEAGAFFTPFGLARDMMLEVAGDKLIDLCAGIGALSFAAYHINNITDITCIELNHSYYKVGKKILPEANWINDSIFNKELINSLPNFDICISNPPFGKIKTGIEDLKKYLSYKGSEFELMTIEIASKVADKCTFIMPQMSTPFRYSGEGLYRDLRDDKESTLPQKVEKFIKETGFIYDFNCGIDTNVYIDNWKGVKPLCEIISIDFNQNKNNIQTKLF
jgi:type I restriction-modification system DNA methylase subunit